MGNLVPEAKSDPEIAERLKKLDIILDTKLEEWKLTLLDKGNAIEEKKVPIHSIRNMHLFKSIDVKKGAANSIKDAISSGFSGNWSNVLLSGCRAVLDGFLGRSSQQETTFRDYFVYFDGSNLIRVDIFLYRVNATRDGAATSSCRNGLASLVVESYVDVVSASIEAIAILTSEGRSRILAFVEDQMTVFQKQRDQIFKMEKDELVLFRDQYLTIKSDDEKVLREETFSYLKVAIETLEMEQKQIAATSVKKLIEDWGSKYESVVKIQLAGTKKAIVQETNFYVTN